MTGPLTVVLPCAGHGSRLGLPFPKELLPTPDGRVALDATFDLLADVDAHVVLVVDAGRAATFAHVHARHAGTPAAFVRQPADTTGLCAAIRAALPWCGLRILVLLPDQILLSGPAGRPVAAAAALLGDQRACFLAARETDPRRIARDGALRIEQPPGEPGTVVALADHPPLADAARFNAVWFGLGIRREAAEAALADLDLAIEHSLTPDRFAAGPLHRAGVVEVPPFTDLGTWPALRDFWAGAT